MSRLLGRKESVRKVNYLNVVFALFVAWTERRNGNHSQMVRRQTNVVVVSFLFKSSPILGRFRFSFHNIFRFSFTKLFFRIFFNSTTNSFHISCCLCWSFFCCSLFLVCCSFFFNAELQLNTDNVLWMQERDDVCKSDVGKKYRCFGIQFWTIVLKVIIIFFTVHSFGMFTKCSVFLCNTVINWDIGRHQPTRWCNKINKKNESRKKEIKNN